MRPGLIRFLPRQKSNWLVVRTAKCSSRVKSRSRAGLSLSYIRGKLHLSPVSTSLQKKKAFVQGNKPKV